MATPRSLDRLIRPRTIAVFGGKEARRVIEQCDKMGFTGEIWPVHPREAEILGRKCYRSVTELPGAPDASFVGVNRQLTIDIIRDLAARGSGGAVCYASGFREAASELDDGNDMQEALVAAAGDMPIVGPNCYGFINMLDGALLWPDQHGMQRVEKGVAILTQSSNIACNISMQTRGLPLAYIMTAGNQAQTGLSDIACAVLEDPRVTAVGLHIEGFDSMAALERLATRARELGKSVVTLKIGKSEAAQLATVSHTASLAGNDRVSSALLARLGIGRVDTLPALLETLKLLHVAGPLASRDISSMSCSGGEASLMADAGERYRVNYRPLRDEQKKPLKDALGEMVTIANPLDYHTFVWGNREKQTTAFTAMMKGGYAINLLVLDFPRLDRCDPADWETTCHAVIDAARAAGARAGIVASLGENMPEATALFLMKAGIVPFFGIEEALAAIETAADIGAAWAKPAPPRLLDGIGVDDGEAVTLSEHEAKVELAAAGLTVPKGKTAASAEEAANAAEALGFPVVLKGLGVAHKTEAGAVKLNLASRDEVFIAAKAMAGVASGYLVEKMVGKPVAELIIGAMRDPVAGPVLTIGAGGILVELLDDSAILTLPTTPEAIREAIGGLKIRKLLDGYRGAPAADFAALTDAVAAAASYVVANASKLEELDINPLMVLPNGQGAVAADALIRRRN
ncbi:acetate--CoA ligase family protein [Ensifer adhaerens]|uniref:acetate--CoA ligase family protein n=1 Tax=Ensifer adhaerens TaxID=106592 RepID=UPI001CBA82C2|nr:acetate--CoA ligase family protein [Ensifer adhaerens]MBZ7922564.1 acetate--CoA ligase family protein [Ensifer adhaerens]UAX91187.1 acetate--CoA ligase family protein [Ensifer adhaerens]UAX98815.1 acetate--CoA ligase family protein [Ensifer adhaerens]UAY06198.1 acetate--CoA ligase family protein [Ensifer adhaerens]